MSPRATRSTAAAAPAESPGAAFDSFESQTWVPLLQQTFAMHGNLVLARQLLARAYAHAWQHWERAEREGPERFVREYAWAAGSRRRRGPLRKDPELTQRQRRVLRALQGLPVPTRKAIVLAGLSELSLADVAASVGESATKVEARLAEGLTTLMGDLGVGQDEVSAELLTLTGPARGAPRPVPRSLRRRGRRRGAVAVLAGATAAVAVAVGAGALVYTEPVVAAPKAPEVGPPITEQMLLTPYAMAPFGAAQRWQVGDTNDNTQGRGLNSACQQTRFADPQGSTALVRNYTLSGSNQRRAVQTVEVSHSATLAKQAYKNVVGWFAGCQAPGVQLLDSYKITRLGDQAISLRFRTAGTGAYDVGIARSGRITTWAAVESGRAGPGEAEAMTTVLGNAVYRLCASPLSGRCAISPKASQLPPPPSGEAAGMLAVADLPAVGKIDDPWVGTDAVPLRANPASTSCDNADFIESGAVRSLTRTFVIPEADLPQRFGISETYGRFPSARKAQLFLDEIVSRMDRCEKTKLSASVSDRIAKPRDAGSSWYMWRLDSEIADGETVRFWTGVARLGTSVVQLSFIPDKGADVNAATFRDLVVRARDRLYELPARARKRELREPVNLGGPASGPAVED